MSTDRIERERTLHDQFYSRANEDTSVLRQAIDQSRLRTYRENRDQEVIPKQCQFALLGDLTGKVVCDYACGDGADTVLLVANGAAAVRAFDISRSAVEVARRRMDACGMADRVEVVEGNAEELNYAANTFDLVYGSSVLHHLDVERAAREVHRILRPGGRAVFREPYENSKVLAALSRAFFAITPLKPDAVSPQRQLNADDIRMLRSLFSEVKVIPFGIVNRLDRVIPSARLSMALSRFDASLLRRWPSLAMYSRHIVIEVTK